MNIEKLIKSKVREIPDWPKKGISFKDITPLLEDRNIFRKIIEALAKPYRNKKIDKIVSIDARGFLLAGALAFRLKTGLAIIRKKGKLPRGTLFQRYALEYATNIIEIHKDSILRGEKVLLVDDVLATGGTMKAAATLVLKLKGEIVGIEFLIELTNLAGRKRLKDHKVTSLAKFH